MRKLIHTFILSLFIFNLTGQPIKLTPSDGGANDEFGASVAYFENIAVVGSQHKNNNQGVVYVFRKNEESWEEEAILTANDGQANDKFGHAVAIDGDYIIVGANGSDAFGTNSGAAYIYHYDGTNWVFQIRITPNEPSPTETFGVSVAISGEYALIGANHAHIGDYNNVGAAYIFHRAGTFWTQQAKLTASDGMLNDYFGQSVAIDGGNAIIAAQFVDDLGTNSGAAYIFRRTGTTTWTEITKLTGSDTEEYNYFGSSVDISGDYAVVGAYFNKTNNIKKGAAYLFKFDGTWSEQAKLTGSNTEKNDNFGYSVAIDSNYVAIGAYAHESGTVYLYENQDSLWAEKMIVLTGEVSNDAEFGKAVALQNGTMLIGTPNDNALGTASGSVFVALTDTTTIDTTTAIRHLLIDNTVSIYPNPCANQLTIHTSGNEDITGIRIFDTTGKIAFRANYGAITYDISALHSGLYFVEVATNEGRFVKRMMIE